MDSKRLDLNLLVTLEALLTEQNVTKAASRLNLSQPAVSAQLNRLRAMFDDPLLIPAQRGMIPTAKAGELLDPLRQTLDQVRATVDTHRSFDPSKADFTVAIACTDYLQVAVVKPLILDLQRRAPGVRVAVRNLDIERLELQMERSEVDLALMTPQEAPQRLRARYLFDERYVLIARRDHPQLHPNISVSEIAGFEYVIVSLRGGEFSSPIDNAFAAFGHKRKVGLSAASFLFVPEIVAASDFVAFVPARLVHGRASGLSVLECPFPLESFSVGQVWHERCHGHAGQRWIRDTIVSLVSSWTV